MSHSMGLGHFMYTYEGSFDGVCVLQCVAVRFAVRRSVLRTIFDGGRFGR